MRGMCRHTGQPLEGTAHLRQSIEDILSTPFVTRVELLNYGSSIPDLIDAPQNSESVVDAYMAVAEALDKWEPRYELQRIAINRADDDGRAAFTLTGRIIPDEEIIEIEVAA